MPRPSMTIREPVINLINIWAFTSTTVRLKITTSKVMGNTDMDTF